MDRSVLLESDFSTEYSSLVVVLNFFVVLKRHSKEYCIVYNLSYIALSVTVGGMNYM